MSTFLPYESSGMKLGMGPILFLVDMREDLDFSEVAVSCPDGQAIKSGMSKFLQTAIKPNQRNEIKTWSKEVSAASWIARSPNYSWPNPKPLAGDEDDDDDDGDAGQHNTITCDLALIISAHWSWFWPARAGFGPLGLVLAR